MKHNKPTDNYASKYTDTLMIGVVLFIIAGIIWGLTEIFPKLAALFN